MLMFLYGGHRDALLAQVIVGKIADHLPLHRQAKIFKRFGVDIPDQTMEREGTRGGNERGEREGQPE
jgi:transposase